jgi:2-amino-4-hydroxy-6-hydroxymethyldihydropteridine diphosphokinase
MAVRVGIMLLMESATLTIPNSSGSPDRRVVVGMGGNLGDVVLTFSKAILALRGPFPQLSVSPLYRTDPLGPPQPDFLNAALLLPDVDDLESLLQLLHHQEQLAERKRDLRWGPRTLDLDILWASERTLDTSTLTVPHARLTERGFALLPLLDLVPEARDPIRISPYAELISTEFLKSTRLVSNGPWWEPSTRL